MSPVLLFWEKTMSVYTNLIASPRQTTKSNGVYVYTKCDNTTLDWLRKF